MARKTTKKAAANRNTAKKSAKVPVLLAGGNPQIAKAEGDAPVQAYIAAMPGWKRDVGRRLDALIACTVPGVRKAVKWNSPFYGVEGQGWFLGIHCFTKYVKVAFFRGTSLRPVPPGESRHKEVRYLDIREDDQLDEAQLATWIRQAAALPGAKARGGSAGSTSRRLDSSPRWVRRSRSVESESPRVRDREDVRGGARVPLAAACGPRRRCSSAVHGGPGHGRRPAGPVTNCRDRCPVTRRAPAAARSIVVTAPATTGPRGRGAPQISCRIARVVETHPPSVAPTVSRRAATAGLGGNRIAALRIASVVTGCSRDSSSTSRPKARSVIVATEFRTLAISASASSGRLPRVPCS